jgi:hypothetical protein
MDVNLGAFLGMVAVTELFGPCETLNIITGGMAQYGMNFLK